MKHLIHGACRGDSLHNIGSAAIGTDREAATNDFPKCCQIWCDAKVLLCTPMCNSAQNQFNVSSRCADANEK